MINNTHLKILTILIITTFTRAADNLLHFEHADKAMGQLINSEKVHRFVGNVRAYQDTLRVICDEAIFWEEEERADFIGKVKFDDGHRTLWANKVVYYTNSRIAHCTGNVRISGVNDSLYAEEFVYRFAENNAEGKINLFLWDKQNNARVWGDSGLYLSSQAQSFIYGNARFEHDESDSTDTLIITAKQMEYHGAEVRHAIALDSVRIFTGDIRASCDSASYKVNEERIYLRIQPIAWQDQNEMTGGVINLELDSLEIKDIFIHQKAHLKSLADSVSTKYNHLRGKSIQVSLMDRRPYRITARNNASSVYYLKEEENDQGTNSASSDSIIIFFEQGEVDSIAILGGVEGIFYPSDYKGDIQGE
jgi:lipopolysaccharide export system protein LptA